MTMKSFPFSIYFQRHKINISINHSSSFWLFLVWKIIEIGETLNSHQSRLEMDESRISTNEVELSSHRTTLDDILRNVNDHQLGIDTLYQTSAFHQTSIEELQSTTRNLDRLPLGTIMSYHPKNAETFPVGWLPCDGVNIDKGPLMGQRTPGNLTQPNLTQPNLIK